MTTHTRPSLLGPVAIGAYLACIVAANYATARWGLVPVGFGLVATAGTYFAGASFVARDSVQDAAGRRAVVLAIVVGALLSWWVSGAALALASGVTFLVSESADLAVYTPLRAGGYLRAAVASNVVGTFVDTFLFLSLAGFPLSAWQGQVVGKLTVTLAVVALVGVGRAVLRQPVRI